MSIFKDLSNVLTGDLNRKIKSLELDLACLRTAVKNKDADIHRLKLENVRLRLRLSQSHMRDPKTGRILPKGKSSI